MVLWTGAACEPTGDEGRSGVDRPQAATLTVSAAASLADAFQELASAYELLHPGVRVALNFAGSAALATQILEGAPVDLFAPAAPEHLHRVAEELSGPGVVFATNRLSIAVPAGNPGGVVALADLARDELVIGLCAVGVPCGDLAREALARAGVAPRPDTEEANVRALLTKVRLSEVDAALVYRSDIQARDTAVEGVDIPDEWNPTALYSIAALGSGGSSAAATDFIAFVLSEEGFEILARYGFARPPEAGL